MNINDLIHDGKVSTQNYIIHRNDFREVTGIGCDDCITQAISVIDEIHELTGEERTHKREAILHDCYGINELPEDADIVEMAHTANGAYLYLLRLNDYGDVGAVIEGEAGGYFLFTNVDDAIRTFANI